MPKPKFVSTFKYLILYLSILFLSCDKNKPLNDTYPKLLWKTRMDNLGTRFDPVVYNNVVVFNNNQALYEPKPYQLEGFNIKNGEKLWIWKSPENLKGEPLWSRYQYRNIIVFNVYQTNNYIGFDINTKTILWEIRFNPNEFATHYIMNGYENYVYLAKYNQGVFNLLKVDVLTGNYEVVLQHHRTDINSSIFYEGNIKIDNQVNKCFYVQLIEFNSDINISQINRSYLYKIDLLTNAVLFKKLFDSTTQYSSFSIVALYENSLVTEVGMRLNERTTNYYGGIFDSDSLKLIRNLQDKAVGNAIVVGNKVVTLQHSTPNVWDLNTGSRACVQNDFENTFKGPIYNIDNTVYYCLLGKLYGYDLNTCQFTMTVVGEYWDEIFVDVENKLLFAADIKYAYCYQLGP